MKQKFIEAHMKVAEIYSQLSSARRLKVGAIIVKDNRVISIGYNGTPSGWDNNCEDVIYHSPWRSELPEEENSTFTLKTKPEVIHAERNALDKLARNGGGAESSTLFVTHMPCMECSKSIFNAGIREVFYRNEYKNDEGKKFLEQCNIPVRKV